MHFVRDVKYISEYKLVLTFEDGVAKLVDMKPYLEGEIFQPLKDISYFKTVQVNPDIDTIVWENGADLSPDFLYEIGVAASESVSFK
jgi:hypothetical protein